MISIVPPTAASVRAFVALAFQRAGSAVFATLLVGLALRDMQRELTRGSPN
ncbi:hypothetical protein [Naasia lichenicola]|uniref:hypothetical protein n=1 Tax=Naasia lichenicola TaxID=2565933 RepID=UPI00130DF8C5|nr:hypothetical protein [Naasia lichenicola]